MSAPLDAGRPTANPRTVVTDTGDLILAPSPNHKHGPRNVSQARKKKLRDKRKAAQRKAEATGIGLRPKDRARLIAKFTERGEPVPDYVLSLPSQSAEAGTGSTPQRGLKCSEQSLVRLARALKSLLEKEARLEMLVEKASSVRAQCEFEGSKRLCEGLGDIGAIFEGICSCG